MSIDIRIDQATADDAVELAAMVGELLTEIMNAIGEAAFNFDLVETEDRLRMFLRQGKYVVFMARAADRLPIGFLTLYENYALYAEGVFGTIPECYVRPDYRSLGVGHRLIERAGAYGKTQGWKRLEVTTPPLPRFEQTLAFYQREGFAISGGRKLKRLL
jgi:GNAT superfamily N-acetyltransferase